MTNAKSDKLIFELRYELTHDPNSLDDIGLDIYHLLRRHVRGIPYRRALKVVLLELTHNLMEYGDWECSNPPRFLVHCFEGQRARIVTENRMKSGSPNASRFVETMEASKSMDALDAARRQRSKAIALAGDGEDRGPGFGIFRIVDEAGAKVEGTIGEDGLVTVTAEVDPDHMAQVAQRQSDRKGKEQSGADSATTADPV